MSNSSDYKCSEEEVRDSEFDIDYATIREAGRKPVTTETPQKTKSILAKIGTSILLSGIGVGLFALGLAIGNKYSEQKFKIPNTTDSTFEIELTGEVAGTALLPGDKQTVSPVVTNVGTGDMYVFVRFDVSTYDGDDIYDFTPSNGVKGNWTRVETGEDGEILYCYARGSEPIKVISDGIAEMDGELQVVVEKQNYKYLADSDMEVTVYGCGVSIEGIEGHSPADAWQQFLSYKGGY